MAVISVVFVATKKGVLYQPVRKLEIVLNIYGVNSASFVEVSRPIYNLNKSKVLNKFYDQNQRNMPTHIKKKPVIRIDTRNLNISLIIQFYVSVHFNKK